jgi:predicted NAD/FAD-binding protein
VEELRQLLTKRLAVIADKELRERDPVMQLQQLREVSEAITRWHEAHRAGMHERLDHYLSRASFDKALAFLDDPAMPHRM